MTEELILAGDVGGTKTILALYPAEGTGSTKPLERVRYPSGDYQSLEAMVEDFLGRTGARPAAACLGLPGRVQDGETRITNLPWLVRKDRLATAARTKQIALLNDLQALAWSLPLLERDDLAEVVPGRTASEGSKVVLAPGTGLGAGLLVWTGSAYTAVASEAGHCSFAPRTPLEQELLTYLGRRHGHVSFERVCSGAFLPALYDFLLESGRHPQPEWLRRALTKTRDRTPLIMEHGLSGKARLCSETLNLFIRALGTIAGNLALTLLASGGIYLGGGIPPRIVERLRQPDFARAVADKGRFSEFCASLPVRVILDTDAALRGSAWYARQTLQGDHGRK